MRAQTLARALRRVEETILAGAILLIAALTCTNVVTRTALGFSLAWAEELTQFAMLVVTFVGTSYAASRGRHIRMTALVDQLSPRRRKVAVIATSSITAAMLAGLAVVGAMYVDTMRVLGTVSPVLQVPLYLVYLAAPIGLGLAALQYALAVLRNLTDPGIFLSHDVPDGYDAPISPGI